MPNILVVKPDMFTGDPYVNLSKAVDFPWHLPPYECKCMVVDTMSEAAENFLDASARAGHFRSGGSAGITAGAGSDYKLTLPDRGDYRFAQSMATNIMKLAMAKPTDLIICGHSEIDEKGVGETKITRGGMALVGQAATSLACSPC